jgi:hypothetical protein
MYSYYFIYVTASETYKYPNIYSFMFVLTLIYMYISIGEPRKGKVTNLQPHEIISDPPSTGPVSTSDEIDLEALMNMEHSDSYALLNENINTQNTQSAQKIGLGLASKGNSTQDILKNINSNISEDINLTKTPSKGGLGGRAYKAPVSTAPDYGGTAGNLGVRAAPLGGGSDYTSSGIYAPSVNSSNNIGNIDPATDGLGSRYARQARYDMIMHYISRSFMSF